MGQCWQTCWQLGLAGGPCQQRPQGAGEQTGEPRALPLVPAHPATTPFLPTAHHPGNFQARWPRHKDPHDVALVSWAWPASSWQPHLWALLPDLATPAHKRPQQSLSPPAHMSRTGRGPTLSGCWRGKPLQSRNRGGVETFPARGLSCLLTPRQLGESGFPAKT